MIKIKSHEIIYRERKRDGGEIMGLKMTYFPKFAVWGYIVSQRETQRERERERLRERDGGKIWD